MRREQTRHIVIGGSVPKGQGSLFRIEQFWEQILADVAPEIAKMLKQKMRKADGAK